MFLSGSISFRINLIVYTYLSHFRTENKHFRIENFCNVIDLLTLRPPPWRRGGGGLLERHEEQKSKYFFKTECCRNWHLKSNNKFERQPVTYTV